jgi:hypothetical protein
MENSQMLSNLNSSVVIAGALAALSVGCVTEAGDGTEDLEISTTEQAITGTMEYDVAVADYTFCYGCDRGPIADGYTGAGTVYGWGYFKMYGDYLLVYDQLADGYNVGFNWEDAEANRQGFCRHTLGFDEQGSCNKNLPEGDSIRYRVGRCNPGNYDCSKWSNYINRSYWVYTTNTNEI